MIRPGLQMRTPLETGDCWPKQARHTSQMDRLRMRGRRACSGSACERPSGRNGVMASPPPPWRRWLLDAGRCWSCLSARADSLHGPCHGARTSDPRSRMAKLSTVPYAYTLHAWADNQAIGAGPRGRERLRCKVIAYMKKRVRLLSINSHSCMPFQHPSSMLQLQ